MYKRKKYKNGDSTKGSDNLLLIFAPTLLAFLLAYSCFGQRTLINNTPPDRYNLQECAVNVTNNANLFRPYLKAYDNVIMLQSNTSLNIGDFHGQTTFIHGLKALESLDNYRPPELYIDKCKPGSIVNVSSRIAYKISDSCIINIINQ